MAKQQRERSLRERRERKAERKREAADLKLARANGDQSQPVAGDMEPGLRFVASGEDGEQAPVPAPSADSSVRVENTVHGEESQA